MTDSPQPETAVPALHDPFGRCRPSTAPTVLSREYRVALLGRAAHALSRGEMPDDEARRFLADGILQWLYGGGNLCKDHFQSTARQGSNLTEAMLYARIRAALQEEDA